MLLPPAAEPHRLLDAPSRCIRQFRWKSAASMAWPEVGPSESSTGVGVADLSQFDVRCRPPIITNLQH